MRSILNAIGLTKKMKLTVDLDYSKFLEFLQKKVKPNRIFILDVFGNGQKAFYGNVNSKKFLLRINGQISPRAPFAIAKGRITSNSEKTELEVILIGWNWFVLLCFLIISIIFGFGLNDAISTGSFGPIAVFGPILFLLFLYIIFKTRNGIKYLEEFLISELNANKNVLQQHL